MAVRNSDACGAAVCRKSGASFVALSLIHMCEGLAAVPWHVAKHIYRGLSFKNMPTLARGTHVCLVPQMVITCVSSIYKARHQMAYISANHKGTAAPNLSLPARSCLKLYRCSVFTDARHTHCCFPMLLARILFLRWFFFCRHIGVRSCWTTVSTSSRRILGFSALFSSRECL